MEPVSILKVEFFNFDEEKIFLNLFLTLAFNNAILCLGS